MHPIWPNGVPSDANLIGKKRALQLLCVYRGNEFCIQVEVESWGGASVASASIAAVRRINVLQSEVISLIIVVSKKNVH